MPPVPPIPPMPPVQTPLRTNEKHRFVAIFAVFLKLGLTSFGGPAAHLGYFRNEFVLRRGWLSEARYADLVALCQFLPGPASSQVGFCLGVLRGGGLTGGCAAWLGFTLPSALILYAFALGAAAFTGPVAEGVIHGLKLVAVAVVGHAVLGMARSLTPDLRRAVIALGAAVIALVTGGMFGQVAAIAVSALAGWLACPACPASPGQAAGHAGFGVSGRTSIAVLLLFFGLLFGMPVLAAISNASGLALFDAFYRAGALVFGGGHVVLPLLRAELVAPGLMESDRFLAGYGVAQAVPGPLFTFAAYLGAVMGNTVGTRMGAAGGAAIALVAIFLPGLLLVTGLLPFWHRFLAWLPAQRAVRGANAAVVGILGAALYDPVWTSAVSSRTDMALALGGFFLLTILKSPPWIVVLLLTLSGGLLGALGSPTVA
jgi:chromate transporter